MKIKLIQFEDELLISEEMNDIKNINENLN